jgi:predicted patatin/cPLA2 family phospholipase
MKTLTSVNDIHLSQFDTLVFAGGGNRCWWQAGAVSHWLEQGWQLPRQLVGTSAGAAIATACITDRTKAALDACLQLYAGNARIFDWRALARFKLHFAHEHIYPTWITAFLNPATFETVRNSPIRLRVAFTRPARALGLAGSIVAGTLAYIVDKHLGNSIHPRLPRLLGLRQDFLDLHECETLEQAQILLSAAAAAPPFMPSQRINGTPAIDGGYTDNAPIHAQSEPEKSRTLVLLTRHYPKLPRLFRWQQRVYWQPSQRVPVSTWDCTPRTTVHAAFALGERDARLALHSGEVRVR